MLLHMANLIAWILYCITSEIRCSRLFLLQNIQRMDVSPNAKILATMKVAREENSCKNKWKFKKLHESLLLEIQKRQFGHDEASVKLRCKFGNHRKWQWTIIDRCNTMKLKSKLCNSCNDFVFSLYVIYNLLPLDFIFKQNFAQFFLLLLIARITWHIPLAHQNHTVYLFIYCTIWIFPSFSSLTSFSHLES